MLVGGIIGIERKTKHNPAGIITNMFVCLGAAIVAINQNMLVLRSIEVIQENLDFIAMR